MQLEYQYLQKWYGSLLIEIEPADSSAPSSPSRGDPRSNYQEAGMIIPVNLRLVDSFYEGFTIE